MGSPDKTYRGIVVPGRGFGAQRMANPAVLQAAHRLTALTLVPGTLNVRLPQPFDGLLPWYFTEDELGGNVWRDHAPNRTGIRCGEVLIAGRYRGMVFQGDEPECPCAPPRDQRGDRSLWGIWKILMCVIRVVHMHMSLGDEK